MDKQRTGLGVREWWRRCAGGWYGRSGAGADGGDRCRGPWRSWCSRSTTGSSRSPRWQNELNAVEADARVADRAARHGGVAADSSMRSAITCPKDWAEVAKVLQGQSAQYGALVLR